MRNVIHGIIAALLWVVFARYWQIVMRQPMSSETRVAIVTLGGLAFLSALFLTAWVYYNVRLARKLQRRQARVPERRQPLRDYLGRWVVVDHPEQLLTSRYIEVEVKRIETENRVIEEKIFRTRPEMEGHDV
jgi:hypothetical protein